MNRMYRSFSYAGAALLLMAAPVALAARGEAPGAESAKAEAPKSEAPASEGGAEQTAAAGAQAGTKVETPDAESVASGAANHDFMQAISHMDQAMRTPMIGDADQDFAAMMKAHHQGAIEMARIELRYGTDPNLRAMAQNIIDAQTREIGELDSWMKAQKPTE